MSENALTKVIELPGVNTTRMIGILQETTGQIPGYSDEFFKAVNDMIGCRVSAYAPTPSQLSQHPYQDVVEEYRRILLHNCLEDNGQVIPFGVSTSVMIMRDALNRTHQSNPQLVREKMPKAIAMCPATDEIVPDTMKGTRGNIPGATPWIISNMLLRELASGAELLELKPQDANEIEALITLFLGSEKNRVKYMQNPEFVKEFFKNLAPVQKLYIEQLMSFGRGIEMPEVVETLLPFTPAAYRLLGGPEQAVAFLKSFPNRKVADIDKGERQLYPYAKTISIKNAVKVIAGFLKIQTK